MYPAGLWIRIFFLQIRIQLFSQCGSGSSFKNFVKITLWRVFWSSKDKKDCSKVKKPIELVQIYLNPDPKLWYPDKYNLASAKRSRSHHVLMRNTPLDIVLCCVPLGWREVAEDARTAAAAAAPQNLILYCMIFHLDEERLRKMRGQPQLPRLKAVACRRPKGGKRKTYVPSGE